MVHARFRFVTQSSQAGASPTPQPAGSNWPAGYFSATRCSVSAFASLALVLTLWLPPAVDATSPRLASLLPTGGQRGTELEATFSGERLQDAEEIIWYEPGIQVLNFNLLTNKIVKAQLKIAPDCALGEHHARLRSATGLSELLTFLVGPFPVIEEVEPNN